MTQSRSYIKNTEEFGPIKYVAVPNTTGESSEPSYVPEFVSCIKDENRSVLLCHPVTIRNMFLSKRKIKKATPQVLGPNGIMSLSECYNKLKKFGSNYFKTLHPHPLVPLKNDNTLDMEAITRMISNIAEKQVKITIHYTNEYCS